MLKLTKLSLALVAGALISAPTLAQSKVFATVNGQAIPQYVADAFINEQKAQGTKDDPQFRTAVKEELVRRELLVNEARKKGLDKKADIMGQMEIARQAILIRAFIADYIKNNPVSDAQLKKDYETFKSQLGNTEYKARHILVEKKMMPRPSSPSWKRAKSSPTWPSSPRTPAPRTRAANWAGASPTPSSNPLPMPW